MKKSEIKNGMHVITNDNTEYIVIDGVEAKGQNNNTAKTVLINIDSDGWMPFDEYDDDLHYHDSDWDEDNENDEDYDIKAVYAPKYYAWLLSSVYNKSFADKFTKVWERPKPKKMTKAEIEAELGYEIEIVED